MLRYFVYVCMVVSMRMADATLLCVRACRATAVSR